MASSADYAKRATIPFDKWVRKVAHGDYTQTQLQATMHYKAGMALWAETHPPPVPIPPPVTEPPAPGFTFAGRGIFTTSEAAAASHPCDWYAVQGDPEGNLGHASTNGKRCIWMARPKLDIIAGCNATGTPFIAQAENQGELNTALAVGPEIKVPKALVGNPTSWTSATSALAVQQGWELILEWYWNAQPGYDDPDADGYPLFTNVCFGIYSEGEQGGQGYVPQSKSVAEYRAVWKGSFSVWKAEAMTPADWVGFAA